MGRACDTVFVVADALAHLFLHRPDGSGDLPGAGYPAERGAWEGRWKVSVRHQARNATATAVDGTRHYAPFPRQYVDTVWTQADTRKEVALVSIG